jgi:hypothetical protein
MFLREHFSTLQGVLQVGDGPFKAGLKSDGQGLP